MTEEGIFTPKWDGRQEFTKNLVEIIKQIKLVLDDHEAWYKLCRVYYAETQAFMKERPRQEIKIKLKKLLGLIDNSKKLNIVNIKITIRDELYDVYDDLMLATSHLLLPGDDLAEVDEEDLLG